MDDLRKISISNACGFYKKDKEEVIKKFRKITTMLTFDSRICAPGIKDNTRRDWYILKKGADLTEAVKLLDQIMKWCERFTNKNGRVSAHVSERSDDGEYFGIGYRGRSAITVDAERIPEMGSSSYKELFQICDGDRIKLFKYANESNYDYMTDCITGKSYCFSRIDGYGSVDDADSFEIVNLVRLSEKEKVEVHNVNPKEDKIDKKQSVILFEDTENPYEKTFIGAEFDGKVLVVEATTVEYDGSYGTSVYVKDENVDKLCRCAGVEKGDLLNWIESNFTEESAEHNFRAYCRWSGIEFEVYG